MMIPIPAACLLMLGVFGNILRSLNIKTSMGLVNLRILCAQNYFSNQKSVTELGLTYRSVDRAIADAIDYFEKISRKDANKSLTAKEHKVMRKGSQNVI